MHLQLFSESNEFKSSDNFDHLIFTVFRKNSFVIHSGNTTCQTAAHTLSILVPESLTQRNTLIHLTQNRVTSDN